MKIRRIYSRGMLQYCSATVLIICLAACGSGDHDPEPSKTDEVKTVLTSATWKLQSVTVDGADQTNVYRDMTLKFTSSAYNTTNAVPTWPANGTWIFTDDTATAFLRDDGIEVDIIVSTSTALKLSLTWNEETLGSGRIISVAGDHIFSFVK